MVKASAAVAMVLLLAGCGDAPASSPNTTSGRVAGCGKVDPVKGERQLSIAGFEGMYFVRLPSTYDPEHAYPLGFAFHGANRNHYDCHGLDCYGFQTALGEEAVLVYMQSLRTPATATESSWDDEQENNAAFFEAVLESMKNDYCVDAGRVFLAGVSSGAIFSNLLSCRYGDQLLAAASVSGSLPESEGCRGAPAAILIHGIDDPHVPFAEGEVARDFYLSRNGCPGEAVPEVTTIHDDIREKRDAMPTVEDIACVDYVDCAAPVRWCEHSYGGYDLSTHGWPAPGGDLIRDFVHGLP